MAFVPTRRAATPKRGPSPTGLSTDGEALFKEARRRERRRRLIGLAVVLTTWRRRLARLRPWFQRARRDSVDADAAAGCQPRCVFQWGDRAFVSAGRLWVLDGATGALTAVTRPSQQASAPRSHRTADGSFRRRASVAS